MADKGGRRRRSSSSSSNSTAAATAGTAAAAGAGAGAAGGAGEAMLGCSPSSLNSPISSLNGSGGDGTAAGRSSSTGFERNCSLDKFMETLGALSPADGRHFHLDKRQVRTRQRSYNL